MSDPDHHVLCSLGPARSTTDIVTNIVRLASLRLQPHLGSILRGVMPSECGLALLHEGTHHWCFLTPLGHALAVLHLRARNNLLATNVSTESRTEALNDLLRFEALNIALKPLTEGMAMLHEFDSPYLDGRRHSSNRLFDWTTELLCQQIPRQLIDRFFNCLLHKLTFSPDGLERRRELLVDPLNCLFGGYLAGYMALRRTWLAMAGRDRLKYGDLRQFTSAVRHAIFYDHDLINLALDQKRTPAEVGDAALARLEGILAPERLRQIDNLRLATFTHGYTFSVADIPGAVRSELGNERDSPPISILLGEQYGAAILALGREFERVSAAAVSSEAETGYAMLSRRDWFWLGSEPMKAWHDRGGVFTRVGEERVSLGELQDGIAAPDGEFDCRMDVLFSFRGTELLRAVASEGRLIALRGTRDKHTIDDYAGMMRGREEFDAAERRLRSELKSKSREQEELLRSVRTETYERASEAYSRMAQLHSSLNTLKDRGWAGVFGNNNTQLRALALANALASFGYDRQRVKRAAADAGFSEAQLDTAVGRANELGAGYMVSIAGESQ